MDKDKLVKSARSYLGTPHINGADIKGAGIDCVNLMANIYNENGYDIVIDKGYSNDWYMSARSSELLLDNIEKYCYRITEDELQVGDIIAYRYGRRVSHLAMVIDDDLDLIHAHAEQGVQIVEYSNPIFCYNNGKSRADSFWRVKEIK